MGCGRGVGTYSFILSVAWLLQVHSELVYYTVGSEWGENQRLWWLGGPLCQQVGRWILMGRSVGLNEEVWGTNTSFSLLPGRAMGSSLCSVCSPLFHQQTHLNLKAMDVSGLVLKLFQIFYHSTMNLRQQGIYISVRHAHLKDDRNRANRWHWAEEIYFQWTGVLWLVAYKEWKKLRLLSSGTSYFVISEGLGWQEETIAWSLILLLYYFMCICILAAICPCITYVPGVFRDKKSAMDFWKWN